MSANPLSITVGGLPGTGTSTLCKLLKERLGMPYHYAGDLFRAQARQRGLTLAEFGALCQKDPSVDRALDDLQLGLLRDAAAAQRPIILEGRLSGWLAHKQGMPAVKVWVVCDEAERLRRIVEREGGDLATQARLTKDRERSEADRYRRYYGVDLGDLSFYDLVLDSTRRGPDSLASDVEALVARWPSRSDSGSPPGSPSGSSAPRPQRHRP